MKLQTRALLLSYITVGYNTLEGIASIAAGFLAGSTALLGFGVDSFFESLSGMVMIWRFRTQHSLSEMDQLQLDSKAARLVGYTFILLGLYVLYEAFTKLVRHEEPNRSLFGIVIAIASLITMPILYRLKLQTGKALDSRSLIADSKETLACALLSVALLAGLGLHYLLGWWWADPAAGLVIASYLFKEAYEVLSSESTSV